MAKFQQVTPLRPWPPGRKRAARAAAIYGGGKRRASTTRYSSLNSLRVMDRSRAASKTPLCANSMILDATKRVAVVFVAQTQLSAHALKHDRHVSDRFGFESCPVEKWTNRHADPPAE
jgi:hypothetical protein